MGYKVAVIAQHKADTLSVRKALETSGHEVVSLACDESLADELRSGRPDVCLPVLTGADAHSGAVAGLLELLHLPFVGSAASCCRALSRAGELQALLEAASRYDYCNASTPRTICLESRCLTHMGGCELPKLVAQELPGNYPIEVAADPTAGFCTVCDDNELARATADACTQGPTVAFRQQVEGVHVAVGILGDADDLQVLPPVEIQRGERVVLDAESGIGSTKTDYFAPVRLTSLAADPSEAQAIRSEIERSALDAYLACGCRDLAVVSLVWDGAQALVLDVDTAPALGPADVVPLACEAAQIPLSEVFDALVEIAAERGC